VSVELEFADPARLVVGDNGRGFEPGLPRHQNGLGVSGMRERALLIGGKLEIRSSAGQGTRVELTIADAG
jgi:two-component system sensor histidine kinase UhpB